MNWRKWFWKYAIPIQFKVVYLAFRFHVLWKLASFNLLRLLPCFIDFLAIRTVEVSSEINCIDLNSRYSTEHRKNIYMIHDLIQREIICNDLHKICNFQWFTISHERKISSEPTIIIIIMIIVIMRMDFHWWRINLHSSHCQCIKI